MSITPRLAYERIQPDKVYFVHNHPSGNVKCSYQDVQVLKNMQSMLGTNVEGVIINLKSGKYGLFDTEMRNETRTKPTLVEGEHPIKLYSFDKQVFAPDYEPDNKLDSPEKVAAFVSSHRLGDRKKLSFLVVNSQLGVTANIHTPYTKIDDSNRAAFAENMTRAITEFGGTGAFVYGDFAENKGQYADTMLNNLNKEVKRASGNTFSVIDLVKIEGNNTKSANNADVFEPKAKYGRERLTEEERGIVERAKADGTYMKAPNGEPTKLTERQWVQVRTAAFKQWFGDWEKAARIEKLRRSETITVSGDEYEGKYELNNKSANDYILNNLRGEYTNKDTGDVITLSRKGANKVMHHDAENEAHLKSAAYIPQLIENAIFITEEPNVKDKTGFDSYRYYVVGLNMGGTDYTVKIAVGVKDGKTYYDHALTEIEKNNLLDSIDLLKRKFADKEVSDYKDKRLLSILQTNSSKVVDENGEPLVVYHGTDTDFSVFERGDIGFHFGTLYQANQRIQRKFPRGSKERNNMHVMSEYVSLKSPLVFEEDCPSWNGDSPDFWRLLVKKGVFTVEEATNLLLKSANVNLRAKTINDLYNSSRLHKNILADKREAINKELRKALMGKGYDGIIYSCSLLIVQLIDI